MADSSHCHWCNSLLPSEFTVIESSSKGYYFRFCSIKCAKEWQQAGSPGGSVYKKPCFITSAICETLNKPDDCAELTAMRRLRDTFMQETPEMLKEVHEYYDIAPQICSEIEKADDVGVAVYTDIWKKYLKPAVEAVEQDDMQKAHDIYSKMVTDLKKEYLV